MSHSTDKRHQNRFWLQIRPDLGGRAHGAPRPLAGKQPSRMWYDTMYCMSCHSTKLSLLVWHLYIVIQLQLWWNVTDNVRKTYYWTCLITLSSNSSCSICCGLLLRTGRGAEYCDQCVCLSVCPRAYLWNCSTDLCVRIFCACLLWLWLGPALAALRYFMYFRFYGWRHVWPYWAVWRALRYRGGVLMSMNALFWLL